MIDPPRPNHKDSMPTAFRTLARSQEIEAEERSGARRFAPIRNEFSDDPEGQAPAAALLPDDHGDFFDYEDNPDRYLDEFLDDDEADDVILRFGDGEGEGAIGLDKQAPLRK